MAADGGPETRDWRRGTEDRGRETEDRRRRLSSVLRLRSSVIGPPSSARHRLLDELSQRGLDSKQPLVYRELPAMIHLVRNREAQHANLGNLLAVKARHHLIEIRIAELARLRFTFFERAAQEINHVFFGFGFLYVRSELRDHSRKSAGEVRVVAAHLANEHALALDDVLKKLEHASSLCCRPKLKLRGWNQFDFLHQAVAHVLPLFANLFYSGHNVLLFD